MAISITAQPNLFEFARNAFGFGITNTSGRHARATIQTIAYGPAIGSTLTLRWKDQEHIFTFVAAADSSGTQLTTVDWEHAPTLAADFLKNEAVAEAWDFSALPWSVSFYEKDVNEYVPLFVEVTDPDGIGILEYNSLQYGFFSKLAAELKVREGATMVSKGKALLAFVNGMAVVEVGPKVQPYFLPDTLAPNFGDVSLCNAVLEYAFQFTEFNPVNTPAYTGAIDTDSFFALDGQIPYAAYPTFSVSGAVFPLSTLLSNTRTWRSAHQEFTLLATEATTVTFTAKIYFTDGTDSTVSVLESTNMVANKAYAIPAGFHDLGLDSFEAEKEAYRYEVITSTGFVASFILIEQPYMGKVLRYRNYKGGWQSLLTEGAEVRKSKSSNIIGESRPTIGHTATQATVFKTSGDLSDSFELNLGLFYAAEMELVRDMLQSRFVFRQVGAEWKRIHITTESITLTDESEDINEAKVEFRYATPC